MNLDYILGKPTVVEGVGNIYPVKVKDWDVFQANVNVLMYSNEHFTTDDGIPLFDKLMRIGIYENEELINQICRVLNIVCESSNFSLVGDENSVFLVNENKQVIDTYNYETIRKLIIHQNLLLEPKVYKNEIMKKWAEKALEAKNKN